MKNVKIALWTLAGILLSVVFFQNREFFLDTRAFRVNLYAVQGASPELPLVLYLVLFFGLGFGVAYLAAVPARLKARKELKAAVARIRELEEAQARPEAPAGGAQTLPAETPEPGA